MVPSIDQRQLRDWEGDKEKQVMGCETQKRRKRTRAGRNSLLSKPLHGEAPATLETERATSREGRTRILCIHIAEQGREEEGVNKQHGPIRKAAILIALWYHIVVGKLCPVACQAQEGKAISISILSPVADGHSARKSLPSLGASPQAPSPDRLAAWPPTNWPTGLPT